MTTVYNEMNHRLKEVQTNGLSLSMEYGKRMKKKTLLQTEH
ncbi:MAG: hypothetical protein ACLUIQ_03470 [Dialister invisus]